MTEPATNNATDAAAEDLALIASVLAGDRRAFEPLVRKHERRVFRVTLAVLGNIEDAEEAMQDTFVKAFRHLDQFRRESRFTTWLTRIAVNEAIQKRQVRKNWVPLDDSRAVEEQFVPQRFESWRNDPEKSYGRQELRRIIENAIQTLPEIYREAFVLRDVEEMTAEEAAEVIGITVPAMKSRLLRARLMIRESLAASFEVSPTFGRTIANAAADMGTAMAMRLMKAMGK